MAGQEKPVFLGERKIVTILFADIYGSMALTAGMDPERVDEILSRSINRMRGAVHRYGGITNRVVGDGIMAIFGAPVASEHHAEQGCHAALAILEDAQSEAADEVAPIRVRVGLHSGEVVVRDLISDTATHYEAMGQVVSIAARMEQTAEPGHALISADTFRFAGDAVHVRSLGAQAIKGIAQPMEVFELQSISSKRRHGYRLGGEAASRFVGREPEISTLTNKLNVALAGNGSAVVVSGEAGTGKSRLVQEVLSRCRGAKPIAVTGYAQSFGQRGYQVVITMLEDWLGISTADSIASLRDKIRLGVGATMKSCSADKRAATIQALTALCDQTVSEPTWVVLDPSERRNRISAAICDLFDEISQMRPLVLVAEDLHWADTDSIHVLAKLAESARTRRMLILLIIRDDPDAVGADTFSAVACRLGPLGDSEARELLRSRLTSTQNADRFESNLIAHTGGNPLFIEECLLSLVDTGDLQREGLRFRMMRQPASVELPPTIRSLLGARVDRLNLIEKDVLQAAAVIGERIPRYILEAVVKRDPGVIDDALRSLCAAQFLTRTVSEPSASQYEYRHALIRESVYRSILIRRRREMHGAVIATIERFQHERIIEYSETLAEHARRAEDWARAVTFLRQSSRKAAARNSNKAAVKFLDDARAAAERLAPEADRVVSLADVLLDMRLPLFKLGKLTEVSRILTRVAGIVHSLDDPRRLSLLHAYQSHILWVGGDTSTALQEARLAVISAARIPDKSLIARARFQEGMVLTARSDYSKGIAALSELLEHIISGFGGGTYPDAAMATIAQSYIARAYSEIGNFHQARQHAEAGIRLADLIADPFSQAFACLGVGFLHLTMRDSFTAIHWLQRAVEYSVHADADYLKPLPIGFLGMAYVMAGQSERAVVLLEGAIAHADAIGFRANQPYRLAALARAYIESGRIEDALNTVSKARDMACAQGEIFAQGTALCVLAEACRKSNSGGYQEVSAYLSQALQLARAHGLVPIQSYCIEELAREA